jgi:integrase
MGRRLVRFYVNPEAARGPVHVVSQRLGHASPVITMTVYAHVLPGSQREAAQKFAQLVEGAAI